MGMFEFIIDKKKKADKLVEEFNEGAREALEDYLGKEFVKENVIGEGSGGPGSTLKNREETMQNLFDKVGDKKAAKKIMWEYQKLWIKRIGEIERKHTSKVLGEANRPSRHQNYKSRRLGKPAYHNSQTIVSSNPTTWTGLLSDKVSDAFEDGGNEILKITNLLMTSGFEINMENMPSGAGGHNFYDEIFTPWFKKKGIIEDAGSIVDFTAFGIIESLMVRILKDRMSEGLIEAFNKLDIKI